MHTSANLFELSPQATQELYGLSTELPPPDQFEQEGLHPDLVTEYRERVLQITDVQRLLEQIGSDLATEPNARGYIIVDGVPLGEDSNNMVIPTALCTLVGQPFVMAVKHGLWQELGVDLNAVPYRFQGTGENPFHIDAVNATRPPEYFTFYGIRQDPRGGGVTVVSNLQNMVKQLTPEEIEYLEVPRFTEGRFEGMHGVGEEYKPFPVLQRKSDGLWQVRYTGKMLPGMPDSEDKALLTKIGDLLRERQESFVVKAGQLLVANQVTLAHGRTPLGPNQAFLPPEARRYLRQSYIHAALPLA